MPRYGAFYGPGASDVLLEMLRKRQVPVVGGGTRVWSFIGSRTPPRGAAAVDHGEPASTTWWTATRRRSRNGCRT